MGLDAFDIVLRIKREFGIPFEPEDFERLVRDRDIVVGDLYDHILERLDLRDSARYDLQLNNALWRELQHAVHSVTDVPPDRLEMQTRLADLFPQKTLRQRWTALREIFPYRIGELDYSAWLRVVGFSLATVAVVIEQFQIWRLPGAPLFWALLGIFGVWMFSETYFKLLALLRPWRNRLPRRMTTLKDLCRFILAANYEEVCRDIGTAADERCAAVWTQLTDILVEALDVENDQISFRSRLIRDLGMG